MITKQSQDSEEQDGTSDDAEEGLAARGSEMDHGATSQEESMPCCFFQVRTASRTSSGVISCAKLHWGSWCSRIVMRSGMGGIREVREIMRVLLWEGIGALAQGLHGLWRG